MKTVLKRTLSLVLVMIMLVSVLPLAVSAARIDTVYQTTVALGVKEPIQNAINHAKNVNAVNDGVTIEATDTAVVKDSTGAVVANEGNAPDSEDPNATFSYTVTFTRQVSTPITVTVTKDGITVVDAEAVEASGAMSVSELLAEVQVDATGYQISPAASSTVDPNGSVTITLSPLEAPSAVILKYRPSISDMSDESASAFSMSTTLTLNNHKVPSFNLGEAVIDGSKTYRIIEWRSQPDGGGELLTMGSTLQPGDPNTYYAKYVEDDIVLNFVRFYAVRFVDGVAKTPIKLDYSLELPESANVSAALNGSAVKADIEEAVASYFGSDYDLKEGFYTNSACTTSLSTSATVNSGRNIYLKVEYQEENTVYVYAHKKYNDTDPRIIKLNGYAYGDVVEKSAVDTAVKKYFSVSSSSIKGLFDDRAWNQIVQEKGAVSLVDNGAANMTVEDDSLVIHVLIGNAKTSSNPDTGDIIIMVAVAVLAISGVALAVIFVSKKKKKS